MVTRNVGRRSDGITTYAPSGFGRNVNKASFTNMDESKRSSGSSSERHGSSNL